MVAAEPKKELRARLLGFRQNQSRGEITQRSDLVFRRFLSRFDEICPQTPKSVALYVPIRGEVDIAPFFRFFQNHGAQCLLPKISPDVLEFYPVQNLEELQPARGRARFGLAEPPHAGQSSIIPELVLVPGVAFSETCYRLGFGAGHYDKTLESWLQQGVRGMVRMLGLAYDFQIVPAFAVEPHDHPMDAVLTESKLIRKSST